MTTMVTMTITVWVVERPCYDQCLLGKVDLRNDGGSDLDLRVGLRTIVDGGSRHVVIREEVCW